MTDMNSKGRKTILRRGVTEQTLLREHKQELDDLVWLGRVGSCADWLRV